MCHTLCYTGKTNHCSKDMQLLFRMVQRIWTNGCQRTVGNYGHNSSRAGYCYLPEKQTLCVLNYVIFVSHCYKGSGSHIVIFIKHSANANFMHLFYSLLAFLPFDTIKKKKKVLPSLNSHFTDLLCFCSASTSLICMDGSPNSYGNARMKIEKMFRRDSEAMPVPHTQTQFNTGNRTLKFCMKHTLASFFAYTVIAQILFLFFFFLFMYVCRETASYEYLVV